MCLKNKEYSYLFFTLLLMHILYFLVNEIKRLNKSVEISTIKSEEDQTNSLAWTYNGSRSWRKDMGREHVCHKSVSSFWRTNQRLEAQNNAFPNDFLTNTDARIYAVLARFQALILSNCCLGFIKSIHDIIRDYSTSINPKTTMKFAVYFTIFSCRRCNSRSLKFCRDLIT